MARAVKRIPYDVDRERLDQIERIKTEHNMGYTALINNAIDFFDKHYPLETTDNNEQTTKDKIEHIPNDKIDMFIGRIRSYRRFKIFEDDKDYDQSDKFVDMLETMKEYDPYVQRVYLIEIVNALRKNNFQKKIRLGTDPPFLKLLNEFDEYIHEIVPDNDESDNTESASPDM